MTGDLKCKLSEKVIKKRIIRGENPDLIDDGTVVVDLIKGAISPIGSAIVRDLPLKKLLQI